MNPKRLPKLYKKDIFRFWSKVDQRGVDECWSWTCTTRSSDNRGQFAIVRRGENLKRTLKAPRISYALHYERDPYPDYVLHSCNNANCVNPHHLRLGNTKDNSADSIAAGTQIKGEKVHLAKLTDKNVREIKVALTDDVPVKDLAEDFKVDPSTIRNIRRGVTWKHIEVLGFFPYQGKRLSETEVREIKLALLRGEFLHKIAQRYGVCVSTISHIKTGKDWTHVEVPGFKPSTRRTS